MTNAPWSRWFAWYPVRLFSLVNEGNGWSYAEDGSWAWLRFVERAKEYSYSDNIHRQQEPAS